MAAETTTTTSNDAGSPRTPEAHQTAVREKQSMTEFFGEPISVYTRAQAIEDGVLVDLMQDEMAAVARQHYKFPIACTSAVFDVMQRAVENKRYCNDYAGILHDMLWMSRVMRRQIDPATVIFRVLITGAGARKYHDFKLTVGPGDQGEPVMTLMLPNED